MAEIMAKHGEDQVEDFEDVSGVIYLSPNAKLCGVVQSVSLMKKNKTCAYFDGEISDGKSTMRSFGFDSSMQKKLVEEGSGTCRIVK